MRDLGISFESLRDAVSLLMHKLYKIWFISTIGNSASTDVPGNRGHCSAEHVAFHLSWKTTQKGHSGQWRHEAEQGAVAADMEQG